MKHYKIITVIIIGLFAILTSCKYDNYDPPKLVFKGGFTYKGSPFLFDGRDNQDAFKILQLFQYGYGKSGTPITAQIMSDGSFQQLLFPGDYYITLKNTPYPFTFDNWGKSFENLYDTLAAHIINNYTLNIPVTPYFVISDVQTEVSGTDVIVHFKVHKIQEGAKLVSGRLYVNTATLVNSGVAMSVQQSLSDADTDKTIEMKASIVDYRSKFVNNDRSYMYLRVALETDISNAYFLWSDVIKVDSLPLQFNDVTASYLKNYKQPFSLGTAFDDRRSIVNDWKYSPGMEKVMFDNWDGRKFMSAENWGGPALKGSVWQSAELPAGKYILIADRGFNASDLSKADRAYVSIQKGDGLSWEDQAPVAKTDCKLGQNTQAATLNFELSANTKLSLGYMVNFPTGELNSVSFTSFTILKID